MDFDMDERPGGGPVETVWPLLSLVLCFVVIAVLPPGSPLRLGVTLVAVLLFPGYALSVLLFPGTLSAAGKLTSRFRTVGISETASLGPVARWGVAFGFSVCLMPVYGFLIAVLGLPYGTFSVMSVILGVTGVVSVLAVVRRSRLPARTGDSGLPTPDRLLTAVKAPGQGDTLSNLAIVVALTVAVTSFTAGIVAPATGPSYTTASLVTQEGGDLVAAEYPHDLESGESGDLVFLLTNHEGSTTQYTVVVQAQRVDRDGVVTRRRHVDRYASTVNDGESWALPHQVSPEMPGDRVRLAYLVYRGDAPAEPTVSNAYRSLTLWVREPKPGNAGPTGDDAARVTAPDARAAVDNRGESESS